VSFACSWCIVRLLLRFAFLPYLLLVPHIVPTLANGGIGLGRTLPRCTTIIFIWGFFFSTSVKHDKVVMRAKANGRSRVHRRSRRHAAQVEMASIQPAFSPRNGDADSKFVHRDSHEHCNLYGRPVSLSVLACQVSRRSATSY
jgi:hypothetical protein